MAVGQPELFSQAAPCHVDAVSALSGDIGNLFCGHIDADQGAQSPFVYCKVGKFFYQLFVRLAVEYGNQPAPFSVCEILVFGSVLYIAAYTGYPVAGIAVLDGRLELTQSGKYVFRHGFQLHPLDILYLQNFILGAQFLFLFLEKEAVSVDIYRDYQHGDDYDRDGHGEEHPQEPLPFHSFLGLLAPYYLILVAEHFVINIDDVHSLECLPVCIGGGIACSGVACCGQYPYKPVVSVEKVQAVLSLTVGVDRLSQETHSFGCVIVL